MLNLKNEWYKLKLLSQLEAKIATEFGDGTVFQMGQIVEHNSLLGTFRKIEEWVPTAEEIAACNKFSGEGAA